MSTTIHSARDMQYQTKYGEEEETEETDEEDDDVVDDVDDDENGTLEI